MEHSTADSSGQSVRAMYRADAPVPPEGTWDLDSWFGGDGPLELDVGFGRGDSLFARHEASPESRILGVEVKRKWVYRVHQRCVKLGVPIRVVSADVAQVLDQLEPGTCLERAFVHFPDPWWKKRHAKRRVVSHGFLDDLSRLLKPRGTVFVQTDVHERAEDYRLQIQNHPNFQVQELTHNPFGSISNRESRAEEDGLPIYRLLGTRL